MVIKNSTFSKKIMQFEKTTQIIKDTLGEAKIFDFQGLTSKNTQDDQEYYGKIIPEEAVKKIVSILPDKEIPVYLCSQGDKTLAGENSIP